MEHPPRVAKPFGWASRLRMAVVRVRCLALCQACLSGSFWVQVSSVGRMVAAIAYASRVSRKEATNQSNVINPTPQLGGLNQPHINLSFFLSTADVATGIAKASILQSPLTVLCGVVHHVSMQTSTFDALWNCEVSPLCGAHPGARCLLKATCSIR